MYALIEKTDYIIYTRLYISDICIYIHTYALQFNDFEKLTFFFNNEVYTEKLFNRNYSLQSY